MMGPKLPDEQGINWGGWFSFLLASCLLWLGIGLTFRWLL